MSDTQYEEKVSMAQSLTNDEKSFMIGLHEWTKISDLKRCKQYNGKVGVVISIFDKHVGLRLLASKKILKVPIQHLTHLDQEYAYNGNENPASSNHPGTTVYKGSKYIKLVKCIQNLLFHQESTPILIEETPSPISSEYIKFWKTPCIGFKNPEFDPRLDEKTLANIPQNLWYLRLPDPCLIEALLMRDVESLVELVNFQKECINNLIHLFREKIRDLLLETFPKCEIVEAGSSSRNTNAMPISDLDFVCNVEPGTDAHDALKLRKILCTQIVKFYPSWNMKLKETAVGIETSISFTGKDGVPLLPYKVYADVVITSSNDKIKVAKMRREVLSGVPPWALDAARILKIILKCKMWPSVEHRPPSYMVDVVIRYMWQYGVPQLCTRKCADPRPYINIETKCYMFWKSGVKKDGIDDKCANCNSLIKMRYWECPRCNVFICKQDCADKLKVKLGKRLRRLKRLHPFPKEAVRSFDNVAATEYSRFGNRQWLNPVEWKLDHGDDSAYNFIIAFFHFGTYLDKMEVIFDTTTKIKPKDIPYIQDPAHPTTNIIEKFKPNSFINFCYMFVDDSSRGFYEMETFFKIRQALYNPFNILFEEGLKITVLLSVPVHEILFECLIDPRWSYQKLLDMHQAKHKEECPNELLWEQSKAKLVDHRGLVQDYSVSFLSRGVTFGHVVYLLSAQSDNFEGKFTCRWNEYDDFVQTIDDTTLPSEIREPRYFWTMMNPWHPKVLVDSHTGAMCYFSPSLNMIRNLGPDFDSNPVNFPKEYRPVVFDGEKFIDKDEYNMRTKLPYKYYSSMNTTFYGNNLKAAFNS